MPVREILESTFEGKKVIAFINEKGFINKSSQTILLNMLFEKIRADNGSPAKS